MKRIIIGITGASGVIYGVRLIEILRSLPETETSLLVTDTAKQILACETDSRIEDVLALADHVYEMDDICAPIASGSNLTDGMVIAPCSIKTMSMIAHSHSENLLLRAADVTLKEGRKLVLLVRETPLHLGHLRALVQLSEMGAVILPPVPAFYHRPKTIEDMILATLSKVLDQFSIPNELVPRWGQVRPPEPTMQVMPHPKAHRSSRSRPRRGRGS